MSTRAWVTVSFVVGLGAAYGAGCGSDVNVTDGGDGGAGGSGSTTTVTTATTTTTATTSTTTTSTGVGPGEGCDDACAYAADCGLDVCSFANIDCSTGQFDCPADCINGATCAEIVGLLQGGSPELQGCLQGCQGGGTGGGGPGQECGTCLFQNDCPPQGCQGNPDCSGWGQCAIACSTPECHADCRAAHPEAAAFFGDFYACACTACDGADACGPSIDPCAQGAGGMGGMGGVGGGAN